MPVALSQIRDLLLPGLWGISGKYSMIERQWPKVFRQTDSVMALERRAAMRYLGYAQLSKKADQRPSTILLDSALSTMPSIWKSALAMPSQEKQSTTICINRSSVHRTMA